MLNAYLAPGIAEHVTFDVHPAVRRGKGGADDCPTEGQQGFRCPDEPCGCPHTRWVLCGLHATETSQDQKIKFLTCVDQRTVAYSDEWATSGQMPNPMQATIHCANQTRGLNLEKIQECGGNITSWDPLSEDNFTEDIGKQSLELIGTAADYMKVAFPDGIAVPHVVVDDEELNTDTVNLVDGWNITKHLCKHMKHNHRAAICSVVDEAATPDWIGLMV